MDMTEVCIFRSYVLHTRASHSTARLKTLQNILQIHRTFQWPLQLKNFSPGPVIGHKSDCPPQARDMQQPRIAQYNLTPATNVDHALARQDKDTVIPRYIGVALRSTQWLAAAGSIGTIVGIFSRQQAYRHRYGRQHTILKHPGQFFSIKAMFAYRAFGLLTALPVRSLLFTCALFVGHLNRDGQSLCSLSQVAIISAIHIIWLS